ncbi:hypothetical protein RAS2_22190 [Phycisphaerae bacterium RAS2]|nr:hypothetical protein RAS2_22190 [Phycisphaerae bacterium RAS2]
MKLPLDNQTDAFVRAAGVGMIATLLISAAVSAGPGAASGSTSRPASQPSSSPAVELPDPPAGFSWKRIDTIGAAFLQPKGWHYRRMGSKDSEVYRISKDNTKKGEPFLTGLTVNVTRNVTKKSKISAKLYAVHYMKEYTKNVEVKLKPSLDKFASFDRLIFEVVKPIPESGSDGDFRVRIMMLANEKTDTLYTLFFGAPEEEWESAWKVGKRMLGLLYLDDDV